MKQTGAEGNRSASAGIVGPLLVLRVLASIGCDVGQAGNEGIVVRDSAGIEIVESASPRWRAGQGWRVSDSPVVSIGSGLSGDPATQFGEIGGLARFADGRIAVLDERAAELRFFDSTGAHIRTVGRKGGGPGEFNSSLLTLDRLPGDSLLVKEFMPPRQSRFTATGEFVRLVRPVPAGGSRFPLTAAAHFSDGTAIMTSVRAIEGRTGSWVDSTPFFVAAPGSDSAAPFGRFPFQRFTGDGTSIANQAFGPTGGFTIAGDRFYFGFPERYEIAEYDRAGRLARLIRRAWSPIAVPQTIRDAHHDTMLARARTPLMRDRAEATRYAETFPAYDLLRADLAGNLWVRAARTDEGVLRGPGRRAASPQWSVFDRDGIWLGDVLMPDGLDVSEIGATHVAGVWYDEDDVPSVRVYRLIKP